MANYEYTDFLYFFVTDSIKYNIDRVPKNITLEIIRKLNEHKDFRRDIAKQLEELLN
ncbi:MAG: hypothetical protein U0457_08760 [Candidatus Sericytochromatia bacterium]